MTHAGAGVVMVNSAGNSAMPEALNPWSDPCRRSRG